MAGFGRILPAILAAAFLAGTAEAQQAPYPNKPIRVLIPYGPGGLTDVVARHYADHLRKSLGQNILVENKPGASGIRAIEEMVHVRHGPELGAERRTIYQVTARSTGGSGEANVVLQTTYSKPPY